MPKKAPAPGFTWRREWPAPDCIQLQLERILLRKGVAMCAKFVVKERYENET